MMSLVLFTNHVISELSDKNHPKHMEESELNSVRKFFDNVFTFNKETCTSSVMTKDPEDPCFLDYVEHRKELSD
jgi:hypothetical protein